ncbi:hypothetical protein GPJ56_003607 [Histomonas meleagridis]|uniref:uncharacterized protein n=1 Tax=Histomonas meleagridis TaxID=135588 RepID=UPI00355A0709|nr:hypothetical protein GPJ56_003607 [Histomonas meleagridis]KAH0800677.1 hypothetical protein GO595_006430 [Histomonas meleagridis]
MTRESIRNEPILDDEIVQQNEELMEQKFPDFLMNEWNENVVPIINTIISNYKTMPKEELRSQAHKCAGSALQIGGNQLGIALRTISHMVQAGNIEAANGILEDLPGYLDTFQKIVKESQ